MYALIDCNNFYVSCERIFQPHLRNKPIIVLSNNDGCIIARSDEAKQCGIDMGIPFYKVKDIVKQNQVITLSSNYSLYGDISRRIMHILEKHCEQVEIYSIDESFLLYEGYSLEQIQEEAYKLQQQISQWVGVPVTVGIGKTKSLAKLATHIAKRCLKKPVYMIANETVKHYWFQHLPLSTIWGIGRNLTAHFQKLDIFTIYEFYKLNRSWVRDKFHVVAQKIHDELHDIPCFFIDNMPQKKKNILSSRSFGFAVKKREHLEEAISNYVCIAAQKMRSQGLFTETIMVSLRTNKFNKNAQQYRSSFLMDTGYPTQETPYLISLAKQALEKIYIPGYAYHKAAIMLLDLKSESPMQPNLFAPEGDSKKSKALMELVDKIQNEKGSKDLFFAAQGIEKPWQMKSYYRSPKYTTCWDELLNIS